MFRELLQNADDARATEVQIGFQTSVYAGHSAGANGKANGINGTIPNLRETDVSPGLIVASNQHLASRQLFKWVVRNNGDFFEDKDWDRLTKIGTPSIHPIKISLLIVANSGWQSRCTEDWSLWCRFVESFPMFQSANECIHIGFYTVFSVTDCPLVVSGGKCRALSVH